ncbi:glycosyltransferase family 29 protein, partial [Phaeovulum sp.]|uniref:glycosyltransferase family 29 protein n=1 Tax=Phaeovulum sp. TaxID=2934796 RepID=UPI00356528D3
MTPLRFGIARLLGNEEALTSLTETQDRLMEELQSKHVALVGNARALANTSHGAAIEAAELVVRINSAP